MSLIKVLVIPVGRPPEVREIEGTLEGMQAVVGGFIEAVALEDAVDLICNEEGKLTGLAPNRPMPELDDIICGDFFISRRDEEGMSISLKDEDIRKYTERFT